MGVETPDKRMRGEVRCCGWRCGSSTSWSPPIAVDTEALDTKRWDGIRSISSVGAIAGPLGNNCRRDQRG